MRERERERAETMNLKYPSFQKLPGIPDGTGRGHSKERRSELLNETTSAELVEKRNAP